MLKFLLDILDFTLDSHLAIYGVNTTITKTCNFKLHHIATIHKFFTKTSHTCQYLSCQKLTAVTHYHLDLHILLSAAHSQLCTLGNHTYSEIIRILTLGNHTHSEIILILTLGNHTHSEIIRIFTQGNQTHCEIIRILTLGNYTHS